MQYDSFSHATHEMCFFSAKGHKTQRESLSKGHKIHRQIVMGWDLHDDDIGTTKSYHRRRCIFDILIHTAGLQADSWAVFELPVCTYMSEVCS